MEEHSMTTKHTRAVLGSLTILSLSLAAIGAPAFAQQAPAATESTDTGGLQTVVVTAQKRTQNVKEVPIAMSVVNAAQLERAGVRDIGDLAKTAASLEFGDQKSGGAGGSASIRGIGASVFTVSAESSVGVVVDGVPLGNTASGLMLDLARVEVLRGPQGTLFGKNASAGVLNMTTQAPMIGDSSGSVSLETKGHRGASLRGTVNLPINDISALRASAIVDRSTGDYHNVITGEDSNIDKGGLRVRYLLKPNSDLTINLIGEASKSRATGAVFFAPMVANASNTAGNHKPLAEFAACGVTVSKTNNDVCSDATELRQTINKGVSGQVDWTLPGGSTLTSITAARKNEGGPDSMAIDMSLGYDKIRAPRDRLDNTQVSQEVRIASPAKQPIEYVVGAFYANAKADKSALLQVLPSPFAPSPPVPRSIVTDTVRSADLTTRALFGQATFRLNDAMSVLAGLRYTRDSVDAFQSQSSVVSFANFALPATVKSTTGSSKESNLSGKVGFQYAVSKDFNAYASLSRGYKGPQIDESTLLTAGATTGAYPAIIVRPEIPTSFEVGAKMALLNRKVDLDVAVFHTSIKDFQEQNCTITAVGALACTPLNVPKVTSKGVEIDLRARPVPELQVGISMAAILGTEYPSGFTFDNVNVGGERLLYSPKMKATLSAEYTFNLPGEYELKLGGDLVHKTAVRYCNSLDANCSFNAHTISGLRLALRSPDDKWGVTLFGRNLGDKRVPNAILYPLPGKGAGSGFAYSLGENSFRIVGLSLDAKF
jgi:iron complex outermembrane receptor protein